MRTEVAADLLDSALPGLAINVRDDVGAQLADDADDA